MITNRKSAVFVLDEMSKRRRATADLPRIPSVAPTKLNNVNDNNNYNNKQIRITRFALVSSKQRRSDESIADEGRRFRFGFVFGGDVFGRLAVSPGVRVFPLQHARGRRPRHQCRHR